MITLLITPVAYSLFDDLGHWLPAWLGRVRARLGLMPSRPAASVDAVGPHEAPAD